MRKKKGKKKNLPIAVFFCVYMYKLVSVSLNSFRILIYSIWKKRKKKKIKKKIIKINQ